MPTAWSRFGIVVQLDVYPAGGLPHAEFLAALTVIGGADTSEFELLVVDWAGSFVRWIGLVLGGPRSIFTVGLGDFTSLRTPAAGIGWIGENERELERITHSTCVLVRLGCDRPTVLVEGTCLLSSK